MREIFTLKVAQRRKERKGKFDAETAEKGRAKAQRTQRKIDAETAEKGREKRLLLFYTLSLLTLTQKKRAGLLYPGSNYENLLPSF